MQAGDVIQNRYELVEPLGEGGMAVVWRAFDRLLERTVAIKLMAPAIANEPSFLVRFLAEAQGAARISHPNVVSVLDFGDEGGRPFLVMEDMTGGSVAQLCGAPVMPERALEIVVQAARGAGAAHRAGMVHRDIKPANILLDAEGHAKLADFGIASAAGAERLTATGAAIGSPHYISPEQAQGRQATPASDVYALGGVLYELLTGRRVFEGDSLLAVAFAHVERDPTPPSALVDGLDPSWDAVVLRCLAKDPARRFADGTALARALEGGDLVPTGPFPAASRAAGGWRRRSLLAASAAVLAAAVWLAGWALSGASDRPTARAARRLPKVDFEAVRRSPKPSSTNATAPVVATTPSPTASPSPPAEEALDEVAPSPKPRPQPATPTPEPKPSPTPAPTTPVPTPEPSEPEPPIDGPPSGSEQPPTEGAEAPTAS